MENQTLLMTLSEMRSIVEEADPLKVKNPLSAAFPVRSEFIFLP